MSTANANIATPHVPPAMALTPVTAPIVLPITTSALATAATSAPTPPSLTPIPGTVSLVTLHAPTVLVPAAMPALPALLDCTCTTLRAVAVAPTV